MIIVKLIGGIGNQMFQYACGHALALKYGVPLALDHSFLEQKQPPAGMTSRNYELNAFGINLRLSPKNLPPLLRSSDGWGKRLLQAVSGKKYHKVFEEDDAHLDLSFSWWGAWLGGSPDKIVLCPERWYVTPRLAHVNPAPLDWIRI